MLDVLSWPWRAASRFAASRVAFHAVVALLFFLPHLFGSRESPEPYKFGVPRINSGDEPHYLVFIHSLVDDGDLSLANNYANVHRGSEDAGYLFRGSALNHHTIWFVGDRRVHWYEYFDQDGAWGKDPEGHPFPLVRKGMDEHLFPKAEAPWNSAGMPILLSPIFYAAKRLGFEPWFEPLATVLSGLAILIASLFWRVLASAFTSDRRVVNVGVALAFLGTPAWHYGRSFFSEPILIMLLTGAYAFALGRQRYVLSGFLVGMALFVKPIALLMGLPIGVFLLARGRVRDIVQFSVPLALWIGAQLVENAVLYGSPFHGSNNFVPGHLIANGLQMLAHPNRGILATAPIVMLAVVGWGPLLKQSRAAAAPLAACVLFFIVNAYNYAWSGGYAYSARFLVPLMPIFCIGLIPLLRSRFHRGVMLIGTLSLLINLLAAVQYWRAFQTHPFLYMIDSTDKPSS